MAMEKFLASCYWFSRLVDQRTNNENNTEIAVINIYCNSLKPNGELIFNILPETIQTSKQVNIRIFFSGVPKGSIHFSTNTCCNRPGKRFAGSSLHSFATHSKLNFSLRSFADPLTFMFVHVHLYNLNVWLIMWACFRKFKALLLAAFLSPVMLNPIRNTM